MPTITYKGYELKASSYNLPEKQKWDSTVTILKLKDKDGNMHSQRTTSLNTFNTKKEAIDNAYILGKEIIDGKYPDIKLVF